MLFLMAALFVSTENSCFAGPIQEGSGSSTGSTDGGSGSNSNPKTGDGNEQQSPMGGWMFFILPVLLLVFLFMTGRPNKKETKKREEFIASLKKNDEVVTAGGIVGKVVSVRKNPNTVKLMLDEKSGATMTVTYAAVSRIFKDDSQQDEKEETNSSV